MSPAISIDLAVEAEGWSALTDPEALARGAVEAALRTASDAPRELQEPFEPRESFESFEPVELSVLLADDEAIRELNRAWRGKDRPTNVLSFPAPEGPDVPGPRHLGDLALAFETLEREAREEGKALADHATHLIVHGTLHLLGYDHETAGEAETMEALEVKALATLGIADPYSGTDPV